MSSYSKIKRITSAVYKGIYFAIAKTRAKLFPVPGISILFSANEGFEKNVRLGFRSLRYEIDFNVFSPENIKKSNLLIPLNIEDMRELTKYPDLIKDKLIPIPSLEVINICDDKRLFNQTMIDKGFKDLLPKIGNDVAFPFFLKKKFDRGGHNSNIIFNAEQKEKFKDMINSPDYFCQEMITGADEYATHILFKDHKIITTLTIKYIFFSETPINGMDKFDYTSICRCAYLDKFASVLDAIGFEGLCCFDYKVINGKPYLFEINPRLGGSLSRYFFSFLHLLN